MDKRKVERALNLLRSIPVEEGEVIELCYSGGKDSDVILELAKMANIPYKAMYKNTTIDPPGTIMHCKSKGVEIVQPKKSFWQIVREIGRPNRFRRFCCAILKEYKILDKAILGVRRDESTKRAKKYKEPEECRVYSKKEKVRQYYPILDWTDRDVEEFIKKRNIKCHPLYYDENGNFNVKKRLGCIGCPLASGNGKYSYLQYPKFLKVLVKNLKIYFNDRPDSASARLFGNVYNKLYRDFSCSNMQEYYEHTNPNNLFGEKVDTKKFLEDYFNIKLD